MNKQISAWMDEAADDIELEDCGLFDAQRITERVREKLPGSEAHGWSIHTVWGVGYKFEVS